MNRYSKYSYYLCFAFSFIAHFAIFEGADIFYHPGAPKILPRQPMPKITVHFVDTNEDEDKKQPAQPNLISDKNSVASQKEKPKEKVDDKSSPYKEKLTDYKQIKKGPLIQKSGQVPQMIAPVPKNQSPQINDAQKTKTKKEEKNFIKEDASKKTEKSVYKEKTIIKKTTEAPAETEKKQVDRKTDLTAQENLSPQQPVVADGGNSQSDVTLEEKIDDLINNPQTDLKSVAQVIKEFNFYTITNGLSEYFAKMRKIIRRNWLTRITMNYSTEMFSSEATVIFKISQNGEIDYIKTVYSNGNPFFAHDCEMSIKEEGKFDPLPENYVKKSGKNYYWVIINFGYNILN